MPLESYTLPVNSEPDLLTPLRRYWGYDAFRPLQESIVRSLLAGRDTCVVMPTGGGKSLCYQLPAAMSPDKTVIVISPLIALMEDQVAQLGQMGISAALLEQFDFAGAAVSSDREGARGRISSPVSFAGAAGARGHHRMAAGRADFVLRD